MMTSAKSLVPVIVMLLCPGLSRAQNVSGSISGTVVDPQHAVINGAIVTAVDEDRKFALTGTTENGRFIFPQAPAPGNYTITVKAPGFKNFIERNVALDPDQQRSVGDVQMEIGGVTESVEVSETAVVVNTETAERADTVSAQQIQDTAIYGRNPLDLVKLLPGVVDTANFSNAGTGGLSSISANGAAGNQNNLTFNGITNVDTGSNGSQNATISIDSVQELRVLTGSYDAEYGRSAGAQINVVTKSGTSQLHGSGYWAYRHEGLNANTWLNNRIGVARSRYRQNDPGYTVGGPVYIPKIFPHKDKLFFFGSQEYQNQLVPGGLTKVVVPTALERTGNFSQSINNTTGAPFTLVKNPTTGTPFSGSIIPASLQYGPSMTLLNYLPLPTNPGLTGGNYITNLSGTSPRREDLIQIDYNATSKLRFFGNWIGNTNNQLSPYSGLFVSENLPLTNILQKLPGYVWQIGATWIVTPSSTNQFTFGSSHNQYDVSFTSDVWSAAKIGATFPVLFPGVTGGLVPNFTYAGSSGIDSPSPNIGDGSAPYHNDSTLYDLNDTFSKVVGAHTLKTGIYWEKSLKDENFPINALNGYSPGSYNFGENPSNPYDSGIGMANMELGVFNTFTQTNITLPRQSRYQNLEFFAQDSWKITSRISLNYGIRGAWYQPTHTETPETYNFYPGQYSAAQAPRFYLASKNAAGTVVAIDPATGATAPNSSFIGTLVPNSGNLADGLVKDGTGIAARFFVQDRGIEWGPRLGTAWDIFGNHKLVLRTGGGVYYDRTVATQTTQNFTNYPLFQNPLLTYGYVNQLVSATPKIGTQVLAADATDGHVPTVYNYNFGLQGQAPGGTVIDVAYVGNRGMHLPTNFNINAVPYGAAFLPQSQNPTASSTLPGGAAYAADVLRPYAGFNTISLYQQVLTSNYNSLQMSANRRISKALTVQAAYTWSKFLYVSGLRPDNNTVAANYGLNPMDRRQVAAVNYIYALPTPFRSSPVLSSVAGGWQIAGVTRFSTGAPGAVTPSITGWSNANLTGSSDFAPRIVVTGASVRGSGSAYNYLNAAAFAPPQPGSIGMESGIVDFTQPGFTNFDVALTKAFKVKEKWSFEMRFDAFNVFNHTEFSSINSTLAFSSPSNPVPTNTNALTPAGAINTTQFGSASGVQSPRQCQVTLHIRF